MNTNRASLVARAAVASTIAFIAALLLARCGQSVRPELPRPRLRWPLSTSRVATSRPVLRWFEEESTIRARDVHVCRDRAMARDCRAQRAPDRATELAIAAPLAPGRWFWTVTSRGAPVDRHDTVWQFTVKPAASERNRSWGSRPDFDNDGFDDVLLTTLHGPSRDAHILLGAPSVSAPRRRALAAPSGWLLAARLAPTEQPRHLQDVDGDGRSEIVVPIGRANGSASADGLSPGFLWAFAVLQSTSDFAPSEAVVFALQSNEGVSALVSAGDLDGDGFGDVIVLDDWNPSRFSACFGSRTGLDPRRCSRVSAPSVVYSRSFVGRGDSDGDGADELVFSAAQGVLYEARVRRGDRETVDVTPLVRFVDGPAVTGLAGVIDASGSGQPEYAVLHDGRGALHFAPLVSGLRPSVIERRGWSDSCHVVEGRESASTDEVLCFGPRDREGVSVVRVHPRAPPAPQRFVSDPIGAFVDLDGDDSPELVAAASDRAACTLNVYDSRTFELRRAIQVTQERSSCLLSTR